MIYPGNILYRRGPKRKQRYFPYKVVNVLCSLTPFGSFCSVFFLYLMSPKYFWRNLTFNLLLTFKATVIAN